MKWLTLFIFAQMIALPAHAQVSDQERAQAYYFEAEAALADGRLKDANQLRIKAWKILGGGNPKLEFLAARIYYSAGAYDDAQAAVERFYSHDPGPNLRREIAPYVVKIEAAIEKARLEEVAAAEAKAAADKQRRERPTRIADAVAACVDEESCASSIAKLGKEENQEGISKILTRINGDRCRLYNTSEACIMLAKDEELSLQDRLEAVEIACSKKMDLRSCVTVGAHYLPTRDGGVRISGITPDIEKALQAFVMACVKNDRYACAILYSMYRDDDFGVPKNKDGYKLYRDLSCIITETQGLNYANKTFKKYCESWGKPKRPVETGKLYRGLFWAGD